ncbi:MAG: calcium-binding protein, partial [Cyanobacteria bacterium J06626_18]
VTGLRLIKDFNNDGRNNFDDLLASSPVRGEDRIQFDRLDPGTYFVRVGIGTGAGVDYELQFNTPAIETAQLNLNLLDIFPLSAGSIANPAPVRFEAEIGDEVFEQRFEDDFSPTLLTADVDINQRNIPIKIRAFSLNPDGTETQFDIDPSRGDQEFDATYDTLDRRLFKTGTAIRANEGQSILQIVRGDGEGGRIRLNVTYDTFTESQLVPDTADIQSSASGTDQDDTLIGTDINGLLSGKAGDDEIDTAGGDDIAFGGPGDDLIAGGLGNDVIRGGLGNDTLRGDLNNRSPQSNIDGGDDTIFGGDGNDRIGGKSGNDTLSGEQGDDTIFGDAGNDSLSGGSGDDELIGGAGDDQLTGDQGDDVLTGVDPDSKTPGIGEFDQMTGGLGSDRFVLGDRKRTYYLGQGEVDHAAIFDFSLAEGDVIQLHGEAADYSLGAFTKGDIAGVDISTNNAGELVGSIVGVSLAELSLTDTAVFDFV